MYGPHLNVEVFVVCVSSTTTPGPPDVCASLVLYFPSSFRRPYFPELVLGLLCNLNPSFPL